MDLDWVREVVASQRIEPMPNAAPRIAGMINLRGEIIPVLAIEELLEVEAGPAHPRRKILVLQGPEWVSGILVDAVHRIEHLPADAVAAPEEAPADGRSARFVQGLVRREDADPVPILDIGRIIEVVQSERTQEVDSRTPPHAQGVA
ncbi:chemotaxis protein CheW [Dissulfurirhabdus thermomarina]|nr:chemotaxis protein CheW [Dissulfurirhabdus thermomarina]